MLMRDFGASRHPILGALISLCLLLVADAVRATEWRSPVRALSYEEQMDLAVTSSSGIVVGAPIGIRDTIDADGLVTSWMAFRPESWLAGQGNDAELRIYFSSVSRLARNAINSWL